MDTVKDIYGEHYEAKGRDLPRHSKLTPEATALWERMEDVAWSVTYANGSQRELDEAVKLLAENPGCSLTEEVVWYYIRQMYWK